MKQLKCLALISVFLFMSTSASCSEENPLVTAAAAAASATVAYASGFGPGESALVGAGAGAGYELAKKGYQAYQDRQERIRKKEACEARKKFVKDLFNGTVKVATGIQTVGGAVETMRKFLG